MFWRKINPSISVCRVLSGWQVALKNVCCIFSPLVAWQQCNEKSEIHSDSRASEAKYCERRKCVQQTKQNLFSKRTEFSKNPKSVINKRTPPLDGEQVVVSAVVLGGFFWCSWVVLWEEMKWQSHFRGKKPQLCVGSLSPCRITWFWEMYHGCRGKERRGSLLSMAWTQECCQPHELHRFCCSFLLNALYWLLHASEICKAQHICTFSLLIDSDIFFPLRVFIKRKWFCSRYLMICSNANNI